MTLGRFLLAFTIYYLRILNLKFISTVWKVDNVNVALEICKVGFTSSATFRLFGSLEFTT